MKALPGWQKSDKNGAFPRFPGFQRRAELATVLSMRELQLYARHHA
jgi:hypothetical protein